MPEEDEHLLSKTVGSMGRDVKLRRRYAIVRTDGSMLDENARWLDDDASAAWRRLTDLYGNNSSTIVDMLRLHGARVEPVWCYENGDMSPYLYP